MFYHFYCLNVIFFNYSFLFISFYYFLIVWVELDPGHTKDHAFCHDLHTQSDFIFFIVYFLCIY